MSSVVQKKLSGGKVDGVGEGVRPLFGNVFSTSTIDKVGSILLSIKTIKSENADTESEAQVLDSNRGRQKDLLEEAKAKAFELFADRAGVYSKIQDREGKIDITATTADWKKENNNIIENLLVVGAWNDPAALNQVRLIDLGLITDVDGSQKKTKVNKQNPPLGLATFNFDVHGVSGFKIGDKFRVTGIPDKFGYPSFFQVTKVDHSISEMTWKTSVKGDLRLIGSEGEGESDE